jgi:uncharacterized protein YdeI (YjbR/CyaY-like superfamily)
MKRSPEASPATKAGDPVLHFRDAAAFDLWLGRAAAGGGVWVKFAKQGCAVETVSKPEAIDCALCHGWIDSQIARLDDEFYLTRFTPRKPKGRWSQINRQRIETLIAAGRVKPRGLAEVEAAKQDGRWQAAYPSASAAAMPEDFAAALLTNTSAQQSFAGLSSDNRYALLSRLHHAADPAKRKAMIARFVGMLERGETFHEPRPGARRRKSDD